MGREIKDRRKVLMKEIQRIKKGGLQMVNYKIRMDKRKNQQG